MAQPTQHGTCPRSGTGAETSDGFSLLFDPPVNFPLSGIYRNTSMVIGVKLSLTALFVYGMRGGLTMIAVASLISQLSLLAFGIRYSLRADEAFSFSREAVTMDRRTVFKRLLVGGDNLSIEFWRALRNTFILSFYGLCFGFPMPIILALFFNEIKSNIARSVYQVLTYLPKFMSTVVMTSLVMMLVKQGSLTTGMGIVSQAFVSLGWTTAEVANAGLLNIPSFFRPAYIISGIWEGAGYDSIVFFAAIIAISPTSYEAAQIDGAGKWAQMRYVVLPSILSTIVIMLITRIGSLLNIGYEKVLLLYNTNTYVTADVVSTFAQRYGLGGTGKGLASAAEMMNNVIGMLLVIGANTIARKASDVSLY